MDTKYLLEKAKELLKRDKFLIPVLFVETEKEVNIIGIKGDFNKADKRKLLENTGKEFAKEKKTGNIISIYMVSEANISKVNIYTNAVEKREAIVITKLHTINNKKEILTQEFERSNNNIILKDSHYEIDVTGTFLLEEFMKGYYNIRQKNVTKYN